MLTAEERKIFVDKALENASKGMSLAESSRVLGVSYTTLRRWIMESGEDLPTAETVRKLDPESAKALAASGCSYAFIAREFGVSRERVRQICTDGYTKNKSRRPPPDPDHVRRSRRMAILQTAEERDPQQIEHRSN